MASEKRGLKPVRRDSDVTTTDLDFAAILWKSTDALRGQVNAGEYKHDVHGGLGKGEHGRGTVERDSRILCINHTDSDKREDLEFAAVSAGVF